MMAGSSRRTAPGAGLFLEASMRRIIGPTSGSIALALTALFGLLVVGPSAQRTAKPVLHGRHWMAITGKPLAATAGATIFQKGGNAVDAACAMIAATSTMWDTLGWGGETQALIFNPKTRKVIGVNALGVAPTGATPEFFKARKMEYPPAYGPLAAVTPGTPGGILVMLAEFGKLSLKDVLAPAVEMADGYPVEQQLTGTIEREKVRIKQWPYSKAVFLTHPGEAREAPEAGEIFRQPDLAATLRKLVDAEQQALRAGKSRKDAILAAYDRFYKGDIAQELVRSVQEQGGLITMPDLANWKVHLEEPVMATYKGIEVYKLTTWVQGPAMLQALNMLENTDVKAMGYNTPRYMHALYQVMNRMCLRSSPSRVCSRRSTRRPASRPSAGTGTIRTRSRATRTRSRVKRTRSRRSSRSGRRRRGRPRRRRPTISADSRRVSTPARRPCRPPTRRDGSCQ
jgi:gamma-glutamyltranspeptidase/glutathione hydrolase